MKTILTGDRPTGRLHIGHYVGSLRQRVAIQDKGGYGKMYVFMADVQALTDNAANPDKIRQSIKDVALDYLAVGLDPAKCNIFIQSAVPELSELTTYLMNLITISRIARNPTVKTETQQRGFGSEVPAGFFCYPVSQAADILAFRADTVPVGQDQEPMLEVTRELARRFNHTYSEVFPEPQAMLPENLAAGRLPGTDGAAKMSKSSGNCIYLSDTADEVAAKVKTMYTDPGHLKVSDPGNVEGNPVFAYLRAFATDAQVNALAPEYSTLKEMEEHYKRGGLGDVKCKKVLLEILQGILEPIRRRRIEAQSDDESITAMLKAGTEAARRDAAQTLQLVRQAMRINYW